jgi:ABC-type transport system involved in multi-copper enzyme maturation permease subunit
MRSLLRADRLRFRRRIELWLIGGAVLVMGGLWFLSAYRSDATAPLWQTADEVRAEITDSVDFGGMTGEEIEAEIGRMVDEWLLAQEQDKRTFEENQALVLPKYDVVQSSFTIVGTGLLPMIALVVATTLVLGDEFRYGTVRTSLLAAADRRRFLVARLITFAALVVGLFAGLILLGLVLSLVLRVLGAELPASSEPLNVPAGIALFGSELLVAFTLVAFGAALTLLTRSGAVPLLILIVWVLAELFIANLEIFRAGQPLAAVPQFFLTTNIQALLATLSLETGAIGLLGTEVRSGAIAIPAWGMAAIIAGWLVLFLLIADRRFRTMDIVE